MRLLPRCLALAFLLALGACCATRAPHVAIPEARFRSEVLAGERVKLPLDVAGRGRLVAFLLAGGDTDNIEKREVIDPAAETRYAPLLKLLGDPAFLALEDLTERPTYDAWFSGERLRRVVDAREESPPSPIPVAARDDRYWWIFYQKAKRLTGLMVVKAVPEQPPE